MTSAALVDLLVSHVLSIVGLAMGAVLIARLVEGVARLVGPLA